MPPTPEDIDAARLLVYQWYGRPEIEPVLTVPQQHELADRIAELISAARERGAREEREACAKLCDHWARPRHVDDLDLDDSRWKVMRAAAAIRARGTT